MPEKHGKHIFGRLLDCPNAESQVKTGVMVVALRRSLIQLIFLVALAPGVRAQAPHIIGNHPAVYNYEGLLLPWTLWTDILAREMRWYAACPLEHGYPRFVVMTFMDGNYEPIAKRPDFIPSMQNGMGIISYLKYYTWEGKTDRETLKLARLMGDYLVKESLTPDEGKYPRFTRSTGVRMGFPQPPDCGCQADKPFEIEPDKGGIAGYALAELYEETRDKKYLNQALQNARVLAANMKAGDDEHSPWPFRVDYRTGEARGPISANMSYILRLFDKLLDLNYREFRQPRNALWDWIKNYQIPNVTKDGSLWVQFFEDHAEPDNRNSWSPLNLARYLIEKREGLDPDWQADSKALIDFTIKNFTSLHDGVLVCGEQTTDKNPWGGANSTFGAVLAMYAAATNSIEYKAIARQALNYSLYAVNDDGCPRDGAWHPGRGGWQEDAHTDRLHNYIDAMDALPEWAK